MLSRIYGTAFADEKALAAYLKQLEEAKRRDHRKLGRDLSLFAFQRTWLRHGFLAAQGHGWCAQFWKISGSREHLKRG